MLIMLMLAACLSAATVHSQEILPEIVEVNVEEPGSVEDYPEEPGELSDQPEKAEELPDQPEEAEELPDQPEEPGETSEQPEENEEILTAGEQTQPDDQAGTEEGQLSAGLQAFVVRCFQNEAAAVTDTSVDGRVVVCGDLGVLFVEYTGNEDGTKTPARAVCWNAVTDRWTTVGENGNHAALASGVYSFYGDTRWYIKEGGVGAGGHMVEGDRWTYYLGCGDIASGFASKAGSDGSLPDAIYHGAEWISADLGDYKGGYHSCGTDKYYCMKDGSILKNGSMRVGSATYEFGEDGKCIRSVNGNYWKKERLGYYVRVDENGTIIRTQGFYKFEGETYFLCGNSGRRIQGWFDFKGNRYYFDENTGAQKRGMQIIGGAVYCFDEETGIMQTGFQTIGEVPFYFSEDEASLGKRKTGTFFVKGKRYSFNYRSGKLVTGWVSGGTGGTNKYYVKDDGSMMSGWNRIASENRTYYFEPVWCYALSGLQTIDGKLYLFMPETNAVARNWVTVDGSRYYCDPKTGVVTTGLAVISGRNCFFDEQGRLTVNSLPDRRIDTLMKQVEESLPKNNGSWSVYVCDLATGTESSLNNEKMEAASLIKLFIMGAVFENYDVLAAKYGEADLYSDLYPMITDSDNLCANELIRYLGDGDKQKGMDAVNRFCESHGYTQTHLGRYLTDDNVTDDNYTSVADCGHFLKELYYAAENHVSGSLSHVDEMYEMLKHQHRTHKIPYELPAGVLVANKTGEMMYVENDVGILYATEKNRNLVISIMSRELDSTEDAQDYISQVSLAIYNFYNK